jgi:predicted lipoprotein with Yx(FWY)xxD motif
MSFGKWIVLGAVLAVVVGCERREPTQPGVAPAEGAEVTGEAARVAVQQQEDVGQYLADAQGRALYIFTADEKGERSACFDACAQTWPPLFTQEDPEAAHAAVDEGKLGTIERQDGVEQATYDGWPLYYYVRDAQAGDMEGQAMESFGGRWFLIGPDGERIEAEEEGVIERVLP